MRANLVVLVLTLAAVPVMAQDRLPPISPEKLTESQKRALEEFKSARSEDASGPFLALLRSPEVMTRARAMGDYLRFRSTLPPRLSEFVILLISRAWTQQYEWNAHAPIARRAGVSGATIAAIAEGRRPESMTADEDTLYTLVDELQRNRSVSDATYARAVERFQEVGVIDALGLCGYYTMLAMVMNTARTPLPAGGAPALQPFPRD